MMEVASVMYVVAGVLALVAIGLGGAVMKTVTALTKAKVDLARYSGITDLEAHQADLKSKIDGVAANLGQLETQRVATEKKHSVERSKLAQEKSGLAQQIEKKMAELRSVEEALDMQSFGFYKVQYGFESAEEYKERLDSIRAEIKQSIKEDTAAECNTNWNVSGSEAKGRKMVKDQKKLMLRAFNGEADAAIAKVKYNNVVNLEKRIRRAFDAINRLGKGKDIYITDDYFDLKVSELRLVHEHREKIQEEKEEQRRIKEQMREEQRAQKEIEKAETIAAKEEDKATKALDTARAKLAAAGEAQAARMEALVAKLENELKEALDRKAKAIARAQLTKSGHVYVISNIGSFGEGVYKIGMTRRLEPLDRVKELGDASVPFRFDVHAMIYSENAPQLETALHREFDHLRMNRVNRRKEFFHVPLAEIRKVVAKNHGIVTFVTDPVAEEFRKTQALEEAEAASVPVAG